jgi:hypothetical protein
MNPSLLRFDSLFLLSFRSVIHADHMDLTIAFDLGDLDSLSVFTTDWPRKSTGPFHAILFVISRRSRPIV